jgi:hypothetical protein
VFHRWAQPLAAPPPPPGQEQQQQQQRDNLMISIYGRGLAAALVERLVELPMDIHSGVLDGELHVAANDEATWDFPAITGKVACRGETSREGGGVGGWGGRDIKVCCCLAARSYHILICSSNGAYQANCLLLDAK